MDIDGTWVLDRLVSDDLDMVLEAQGVSQGEPFETTIRRTLDDGGGSLVQVTEVLRADGQVVAVQRVYRRARTGADEQPAKRITGL